MRALRLCLVPMLAMAVASACGGRTPLLIFGGEEAPEGGAGTVPFDAGAPVDAHPEDVRRDVPEERPVVDTGSDVVINPILTCGGGHFGVQPGAPWPMGRRCPSRTASFPIPGSTSAKEAWRLDAQGEWDSEPVIDASGVLYVHDTARGIVAVAHDGSELWATPLKGLFTPSLSVGTDGTIYVWNGAVSALRTDGSISWTVSPTTDPAPFPIAMGADGTVRVLGTTPAGVPALYAVDSTGATVLEVPLPQAGQVQSPLTMGADGSMYVLVTFTLFAMTSEGQLSWSAPLGGFNGNAVISVGLDGTVYVPEPAGNTVYGVTAFTAGGALEWTSTAIDGAVGQLAVADNGSSFVSTDSGGLFELNPDGSTAWFYQGDGFEGEVIADGTSAGYAPFVNYPPGTTTANVVRFAASGAATWAIPVAGVPLALGADGTVYAGVFSTSPNPRAGIPTVYASLLAIAQ